MGYVPSVYGAPELGPITRGPVFARNGGLRRDWDPLVRVPMLIATLDTYELQDEWVEGEKELITNYDIYSGRVINTIRQWLLSPYDRYVRTAKAKGKEARNFVQETAEEASKELWADAQKADSASTILSKKHAAQDIGVQQLNNWRDKGGSATLEDMYMPPPPPKAAA